MINGPSAIRPEELYSTEKAASVLGMTRRNFEEKWIFSGRMIYAEEGNHKYVYGEWVISAIIKEGKRCENPRKSKSSTRSEETASSSGGAKKAARKKGSPTLNIES